MSQEYAELDSDFTPEMTAIVEQMRQLTDDERHSIIMVFCRSCGRQDPRCRCWDDS